MRTLCCIFIAAVPLLSQTNPEQVVRSAIANYEKDWRAALHYSYTQIDEEKGKGVEVSQFTPLEGTPYERTISRNGKPLSPEEEQKEQKKYERAVHARAHETPEQRRKRVQDYEEQRKFLKQAPDAFTYQVLPEQVIDGRPNYVIQCTPKPDYVPPNAKARMFSKVLAKLWIDKEDLRMTKADAELTGPISFGFILARICQGGHIILEQSLISGDTWLPKRLEIEGTARIMLVDTKKVNEEIRFSNYRQRSSTSKEDLLNTASR